MSDPRRAPRVALLAAALSAIAGLSCRDAAMGPDGRVRAPFRIQPEFQTQSADLSLAEIATIRVILRRGTQVALDTIVPLPANAGDSISLDLRVPISGEQEQFSALLRFVGPQGDTLFSGGPVTVTAVASGSPPPNDGRVTVTYTGPGATTARAVRFAQRDTAGFFGDTIALPAVVTDAQGTPIPNVLIDYASLDTTRAVEVTPRRFVLRARRGPVRILARTFTGLADTATLTVQPLPVATRRVAGDAQTAAVNSQLPQPLTVRVLGADSLGVRGVRVRFTRAAPGGALSDTAVFTDSTGIALTRWTLPTAAGATTVSASFPLVPALQPISFSATAAPGPATALVLTTPPAASTTAGVGQNVTVQLNDAFGNRTTFADTVRVVLDSLPVGAMLSGPVRVVASSGAATFNGLVLTRAFGGYRLRFEAPAVSGGTVRTAPFAIVPAAPRIAAVTTGAPPTVIAGTAFTVAAEARDTFANVTPSYTGTFTVALGANPGAATLGGTVSRTAVNGAVVFNDLTLNRPGTGVNLVVSGSGLSSGATTTNFVVQPGAPSAVAFTAAPTASVPAGPQTAITVEVRDAQGNRVTSFADTVSLTLDTLPIIGAQLLGPVQVVAVGGVATFTGVSLPRAATGYRLRANARGVTPAGITPSFTVTPAAASQLALLRGATPANALVGVAVDTLEAEVRDAFGNVVSSFADTLRVVIDSTTAPNPLLSGVVSRVPVGGRVVFGGLTVQPAGSWRLAVTGSGLTKAATALFTRSVPTPTTLSAFSSTTITAPVFTQLGDTIAVRITGAGGVPVAGVPVQWSDGDNGSIVRLDTVTNAQGVARLRYRLTTQSGNYALVASSPVALPGQTVTFTVTAQPRAAYRVFFNIEPGLTVTQNTGFGVAVSVRDTFNNELTTFPDSVRLALAVNPGGATLTGTRALLVTTPSAATTLSINVPGIGYRISASAPGLLPDTTGDFEVVFLGGGAPVLRTWTGAISTDWNTGGNWSPAGVPNTADTVVIGSSPNMPSLVGRDTVEVLRVLAGGQFLVNGDTLVVNTEAVSRGLTIGAVRMVGANTTVAGNFQSLLFEGSGTHTVTDTLVATGDVITFGSISFAAPGQQVVGANFATRGPSGRIASIGDTLLVMGGATFDGAAMSPASGVLIVGGDLRQTAMAASAASFTPTGSFTTIFIGTGNQTVQFAHTSSTSRLANVQVAKSSGVLFLEGGPGNAIQIAGDVALLSGQVQSATSGLEVTLGGSLTGSGSLWRLDLGNGTVRLANLSGSRSLAPGATASLWRMAAGLTWTLAPGTHGISGPLVINGFLDLGTSAFAVDSTLDVVGSGASILAGPGSELTVHGSARFEGSVLSPVAGTFRFRGSLSQFSTNNGASYRPSGTHETVLEGSSTQWVMFQSPGTLGSESRFQRLRLADGAQVTFASTIVADSITVGTASVAFIGDTVAVRSLAYSSGATDANWPMDGKVTRSIAAGNLSLPPVLRGRYVIPAGVGGPIATNTTFRGPVHVLGGLSSAAGTAVVMDSLLLLGDTTAAYTGGAVLSGGGAGSTLTVGALHIRTGTNQNWSGTLRVRGDIRVDTIAGVINSERGGNISVLSTLELIGTGPQAIRVAVPAQWNGRTNGTVFQRTEVFNTSAPITLQSAVAFRSLILNAGALVTPGVGADTVIINDSLALRGSDVTQYPMTGRVTKLVSGARYLPDTVAGSVLQAGNFSPVSSFRVLGDWVGTGVLTVNTRVLAVDGNMAFQTAGALRMNQSPDRLTVGGSLTFATGSVADVLNNGVLTLVGNLSVQSPNAFQPNFPHRTVFASTANAQTADMNTVWNGSTGSRFAVAEFANPLGVQLGGAGVGRKAVFMDTVIVNGPVTTASVGDTVEIRASGLRMPNTTGTAAWWGMAGRVTRIFATALPSAVSSRIILPDSLNGTLEVLGSFTTYGIRPRRGGTLADSLIAKTVVREHLSLRGVLELEVDSMIVLGNLTSSGANESLRQINAASSLVVHGNAVFGGGPSASTAGVLNVRGNFVTTGAGNAFNPSGVGTHLVRLSGSTPQRVVMATPVYSTGQYFNRLEVANAAGVTLGTSAVVYQTLTVSAGTIAYDSAHTFTEVQGSVSVTGGGSLGTWGPSRVLRYAGNASLVGPSVINGNVEFANTVQRNVQAGQTINGDLTLSTTTVGANILSSNGRFTINGNLTIANQGALRLQMGANDTIDVVGNLAITGAAPLAVASIGTGASDASVLILRGNVSQTVGSPSGFGIWKAYRTLFLGSAQQLSLQRPATFVNRRFGRVEIGNGSAPTVLTITDSSLWASGVLTVRGNATLQGGTPGRRVLASDSVIIESGGNVNLGATGGGTLSHTVTGTGFLGNANDTLFVVNGALTTDTLELGGFIAHRLQTSGTGTVSRTHLKVAEGYASTFHRLPTGTVNVPGTLFLGTGSALETGTGAADTTRLILNRLVNTGGVFRMNDGADSVHVVDSLVTTGAAAVNYFEWNQGRVALLGPVSLQAPNSWTSTTPLAHRTWFAGAGRQTIAFPAAGLAAGLTPGILNFAAEANRSSADSIVGILRASRINISGTGSGLTPFVFDDASRRMEVQGTLFAPSSVLLNFSNVAGLNEPGFTYVALGAPPGDTATVRDISASFSPDTLVLRSTLSGVMARFEGRAPVGITPNSGAPYPLRTVVSEGSAVSFVSFASGLVSIANDLVVPSDRLVVDNGDSLSVGGTLRTTGSGYVDQSGDSRIEALDVDVRGTAPSATPTLVGGSLRVRRNFTQAVSLLAFRPDANHTTFFTDSGSHTVSFAHPDTLTGSRFGQVNFLYRDTTARVILGSDIAATGQVRFDASTQVITSRPARIEAAIPRTVFGYDGVVLFGTPAFDVTRVALAVFNASSDNTSMNPGFGLAIRFLGDYGGLTPYAIEGDGGLFFGELQFTGLVNPPSTLMRCRTVTLGTGLSIDGLFTGTPPIAIASPSTDSRFLREGSPACIVNVTPSA